MMLEKGLANDPNMRSWTQVLGQAASAFAGKRLDKKADKITDDMHQRMRDDYARKVAEFSADEGTLDPTKMTQKWRGDPMMTDNLDPYQDAMAAGLKERGEHTNFGGQWRQKGDIQPGEYEPNKPTDSVLRGPDNSFVINPVRTTASLSAQPNVSISNPVTSMQDPMARGAPPMQPPPMQPPGAPAQPAGAGIDTSLLTPDERAIMQKELQRRAGTGGSYSPPNPNTPMGNPLSAQKAPAGTTTDGQPYWIINGVPYDNPEGR
jgi:hypothetical protein